MVEELCRYINRVDRARYIRLERKTPKTTPFAYPSTKSTFGLPPNSPIIRQTKQQSLSLNGRLLFQEKTLHIAAALSRVKTSFRETNREIMTIASQRRTSSHQLEERIVNKSISSRQGTSSFTSHLCLLINE